MHERGSATRESWENQPMPVRRERLDFDRVFTSEEFAKIKAGHIPQEMEDKWFIFFEDNWLYFHRSWTGYCIFQMRLDEGANGWHVAEAWVSRVESQFRAIDTKEALELLTNLFRWDLGI